MFLFSCVSAENFAGRLKIPCFFALFTTVESWKMLGWLIFIRWLNRMGLVESNADEGKTSRFLGYFSARNIFIVEF